MAKAENKVDLSALQESLGAIFGVKKKKTPLTKTVAIWPDGFRCTVTQERGMYSYGRGCAAGPSMAAAKESAADQGVQFERVKAN